VAPRTRSLHRHAPAAILYTGRMHLLLLTAAPLFCALVLPGQQTAAPAARGPAAQNPAAQNPAAQSPAARRHEQLQAARQALLQQPFARLVPWLTDYEQARTQARASGKLVFACFTRSDAPCGPCRALEDGPLADPRFAEFCKDVVPFLHITSGIDVAAGNSSASNGEPPRDLLQQAAADRLPLLLWLAADGSVLHKVGYASSEQFQAELRALRTLAELEPKAAARQLDGASAGAHLLARMVLRRVALEPAQQEFELLENRVPAAIVAQLRQELVDLEVEHLFASGPPAGQPTGTEADTALAPMLQAFLAQNRLPSDRCGLRFWLALLRHGSRTGDRTLADRARLELENYGMRHRDEKPRVDELLQAAASKPPADTGK